MEVDINKKHPGYKTLIVQIGNKLYPRAELMQVIQIAFDINKDKIYLHSSKDKYEIMGDFFAKKYTTPDSQRITNIRLSFYYYLQNKIGKQQKKYKKVGPSGKTYIVYNYLGKDLFAVPEYYHGRGKWTPHLSFTKIPTIKKDNYELYKDFEKYGVNALSKALIGSSGSLDNLIVGKHINRIYISVI